MEHYYLMVILTGIIGFLGFLTWHKTRNIAFPLGILFLYYWSLYGAWAIITDKMGGDSGKKYYYLESKMFTIQLDDHYYWSLVYYGLFVIVVALTVLITAKPASSEQNTPSRPPIVISHSVIMLIAILAGLLSVIIIYPSLESARAMNVSAYSLKGGHGDLPPLFALYEILNRLALVPSAIGLAVIASGKKPKYIVGSGGAWAVPGYLAVLTGMFILAFLMGDKNELVFSGLTAVLFYLVNAERPRYGPLGAIGVTGFLVLAVVDMLRGVPMPLLYKALTTMSPAEWKETAESFSTSNEAFGAHFSMYGALLFHVEPTYGTSFTSLAASIVPRIFWENRPDDIYVYYAEGVQAMPGQGYTIHHATGWYLNFGLPGIILGAVVLGLVWTACYNRYLRLADLSSRWSQLFALITPWTFTSFLPMVVRAGPEAYKGVCIIAFLLPTFALWIASQDMSRVFHRTGAALPDIAS